MRRIGRSARPLVAIAVLALLLGMVALPTLAADPSASPNVPGASGDVDASAAPAASAESGASAEPEVSAAPEETAEAAETSEPDRATEPEASGKPENGQKERKDKAPEQEITLSGTVTTGTDADGETVYSMQSGGTTYVLEAGPKWFFGDDYPLKPFVGKNVTIVGEVAEGSTEVDVVSVDGTRLREPGKPPWAGGWKNVGERHPGWSEEKAARWAERQAAKAARFGDCWPPGHCKQQDEAGDDVAPTH